MMASKRKRSKAENVDHDTHVILVDSDDENTVPSQDKGKPKRAKSLSPIKLPIETITPNKKLIPPTPSTVAQTRTLRTKLKPKENILEVTNKKASKETEPHLNDLVGYLKNAPKSGQYLVDGHAYELPVMPGLEVEGFGPVSFPLVDPQAKNLIKIAKQAPFGLNEKTLVDKKVRDSFQIDPHQVTIKNPAWNLKLKELVKRIGKRLGVNAEIEAKLYKVLVYSKGGHFLKHRDTEKDKNMFGTLIIQPPSIHTGGELVVHDSNGRTKKVVDFGQKEGKSEFGVYFAAHYADLEHELLEVKSGYRLAIVYSLCWVNGNGSSVSLSDNKTVDKLLDCLNKLNTSSYLFGILLEHQYTPQSLNIHGVKALKALDNDRFSLLNEVNRQLSEDKQMVFYLCHAELIIEAYDVTGYENESGYINPKYRYEWEENERTIKLAEWYDQNGNTVFNSAKFNLEDFTKVLDLGDNTVREVDLTNHKFWGKHIKEELGGWAGNEGVTKTTKYSKYLLVMWPKKLEFEMLIKCDVTAAINYLYNSLIKNKLDADDKALADFNLIIEHFGKNKSKEFKGQALIESFELLKKFNDVKLVEKFISKTNPPLTVKNSLLFAQLINKFGFDSVKKHIEGFMSKSDPKDLVPKLNFILNLHAEKLSDLAFHYLKKVIIEPLKSKNLAESIINEGCLNRFHREVPIDDPELIIWETSMGIQAENYNKTHCLVTIVNCLNLFPDQTAAAFETFKQELLRHIDQDKVVRDKLELANQFKQAGLQKYKPIIELFEERKKRLEELTKQKPVFSWSMPNAKIKDHPQVEEFFRSENAQMSYKLASKRDLEKFVFDYGDSWGWYTNREYSATIVPKPGNVALIKKTKKLFEKANKNYMDHLKELTTIKSFLKNK